MRSVALCIVAALCLGVPAVVAEEPQENGAPSPETSLSRQCTDVLTSAPSCSSGCYRLSECVAVTGLDTQTCKECLSDLGTAGFLVSCVELHENGFCAP